MSDPGTISRPRQFDLGHESCEAPLQADARSEIDAREGALPSTARSEATLSLTFEERMRRIQQVAEKYGPSIQNHPSNQGFTSVDQYVADMRGR